VSTETRADLEVGLPQIGETTQLLEVELTDDEWRDRATSAALLGGELEHLERELREHTKAARAEIALVRDEQRKAARAVRRNAEPRPVAVLLLADLQTDEAVAVRADTREVVERRPLSDAERMAARQRALDFGS
jgi:hypothetical protein